MAITRSGSWSDVILDAGSAFFNQKWDQLCDASEKRQTYRKTFHELSMLTDRDLADIGIPRSSIRKIAWEEAYGQ